MLTTRVFKHKFDIRTFLSDRERARDFISLLNSEERKFLLEELKEQQINIDDVQEQTTANKCTDSDSHRVPNYAELRNLAIHQSLPFIGFGFLDNLIMILAGDYIDLTIGVTFGISTMAAAGLGNALSDVAGIGSAFYVERIADKIGVRAPKFSLIQLQMSRTRWATQIGRAFGVFIGCIIGMFPLLFIPHKEDLNHE